MHGAWLGNGYGVTALSLSRSARARACASHSLTCACDRDRDANGMGHGMHPEGPHPPVKRQDFDRTLEGHFTGSKIIFSLLANGSKRI